MTRYTTLTQFIDEQLTRFEIPDTEKNQMALRIKFTRTLQELNIWDNAETQLIGRKHTKVFTAEQLQTLYYKVEPYLLKRSNIDQEELKAYRQEYEKTLEAINNMTFEDHKKQMESVQYEPPQVTRRDAMEVMITALFEKFFEPLDVEQWNDDLALMHFSDDIEDIDCFNASKRLRNPTKYYTKEK